MSPVAIVWPCPLAVDACVAAGRDVGVIVLVSGHATSRPAVMRLRVTGQLECRRVSRAPVVHVPLLLLPGFQRSGVARQARSSRVYPALSGRFAPHGQARPRVSCAHVLSSGVSHIAAQDPGGVRYELLTDLAVN